MLRPPLALAGWFRCSQASNWLALAIWSSAPMQAPVDSCGMLWPPYFVYLCFTQLIPIECSCNHNLWVLMDHRGFVPLVIDAFQNLAEPATVCVGRAHLQQSPAAQLLAGLAGCLGAIFTLEVGLIIGATLRRFEPSHDCLC